MILLYWFEYAHTEKSDMYNMVCIRVFEGPREHDFDEILKYNSYPFIIF